MIAPARGFAQRPARPPSVRSTSDDQHKKRRATLLSIPNTWKNTHLWMHTSLAAKRIKDGALLIVVSNTPARAALEPTSGAGR